MRPVQQRVPTHDGALSACLVALLELDWAESPAPDGEAPLASWQSWLAARNQQLVRIAEPLGAGFWLAERGDRVVVCFGAPPDVVWDPATPLGAADAPGPDDAGWVLASLDPALAPGDAREPGTGTVEALFVADAAAQPMRAISAAVAVAGRGLEGDRYWAGTGHFSMPGKTGQDLTLVAREALDALHAETGIRLEPADARRNVLTTGIDLNALVGRRFTIGEVECLGQRWCEPCAHLQRFTQPGVLRGLIHRGGLRADVLRGGTIRPGDAIVVSPRAVPSEAPASR
ncbi:MAG TPA: MOSC domain-containing protein [Capillimicrobium sp.]|nr:MOSC domain-containing protein [Capillimicrobium sp.]